MGATVNVNNKTVVHAGSDGMSTGTPDMCKTPTPAGPQPMPYPNIAMSSDASQVTTSVKIDGNGVMVKDSTFAQSSGDEPGAAMGVTSNKIKGPASITNLSSDVKFDGKAVGRLSDPMGQNEGAGNSSNVPGPAIIQGPLMVLDSSKVGQTKEEACEKNEKNKVGDDPASQKQAAKDAGMVEGDFDSIKDTCQKQNATVTFRDTNQACTSHLEAGMESKGHDVMTKTFPEELLNEEDKHLAGTVSNISGEEMDAIKASGGKIENAASRAHGPPPLTGDYDMMDMFDKDGSRIASESPRDTQIQEAFNENLPNGGEPPRIMHGCQANYADYAQAHGEDMENSLLQMEKEGKGKGLTAFDKDGNVYRLKTREDMMNFYKCKAKDTENETPKSWNIQYK